MRRTTLDLPRFGNGIGLARTARLAARMGLDLAALGRDATVITGSNGKGSTACLLTALFRECGERVGTFTSPHLADFNERFCVDGEPVADAALIAAEREVAQIIAADRDAYPGDQVGEFEAWFLVAMRLFQAARCSRLVIEAGIGGRYDPTRLLQAPLACIVSVDLEHTALLGATRREIALDKLDVAPPGAHVLLGKGLELELDSLRTVCALTGRSCELVSDTLEGVSYADRLEGHRVEIRHKSLGAVTMRLGLHGAHQAWNASLAFGLARRARPDLGDDTWIDLLRRAWEDVRCPGRLEVLPGAPALLVDVGHTPAAVAAAVAGCEALTAGRARLLLLGVSASKDVDGILEQLLPHFDRLVIGSGQGGVPAEDLADRVRQHHWPGEILAVSRSPAEALACAETAADPDDVLVGLGGLFWAGALRAARLAPGQPAPDYR